MEIFTGSPDLSSGWISYTPTITAQTGAFTSVSAVGAYKQVGKFVAFRVVITITTNGTAATSVRVSLPVTANATTAFSGFDTSSSLVLSAVTNSADNLTRAYMTAAGGGYPGADAKILALSGVYEAA